VEAKAWQALSATLLLERSKFGLNELLGLAPPLGDGRILGDLFTLPALNLFVPNLLSKSRDVWIVRMRNFLARVVSSHLRNGLMDASAHCSSSGAKRAEELVRGLTPELSRAAKRLRLE
jgi:hypothetical protein